MFNISKELGDYGLYITNCLSDIPSILDAINDLKSEPTRIGSYVLLRQGMAKNNAWEIINDAMVRTMSIYVDHFKENINNYIISKDAYDIKTWDIGGNVGFHTDSWKEDGELKVPAISIIMYFTDKYEGGELIFPNKIYESSDLDLIIKPEAGSMAIFKSDTLHRVSPVISGKRISTDINYMNK